MSWTITIPRKGFAKPQGQGKPGTDWVKRLDPPTQLHTPTASDDFVATTWTDEGPHKRQENVPEYMIFPKDGKNKDECAATEKFLKDLVNEDIMPPDIWEDEISYWVLSMTDSQRDEAANNAGVSAIELNEAFEYCCTMPSLDTKEKRDLTYSTQKGAVTELVVVSQPSTIEFVRELKDYVYESHNGDKSFIYHLDLGVSFRHQATEFPYVVPLEEHLQTAKAKKSGIYPYMDPASDSHGTCTAGKALGQQFGVSKKSTLVVVQMHSLQGNEVVEAIKLIVDDIKAKETRKKKSVVTMSLVGPKVNTKSAHQIMLKKRIKALLDLDVPMVVGAGNEAKKKGRQNVNTVPASFEGPEYPLIVVGSTSFGGMLSDFSQRGPHVFLHAPGERITCLPGRGNTPKIDNEGTSFSTAIVAGEIANLLSYSKLPFETSEHKLATDMRNYLKTNAS